MDSYSMTEGSYSKKIVMFALPLFLGNLLQQLYNAADSLIVGQFCGHSALAAVSSSGNLIFLLVGFFNGISMGASVLIAKYYGAKEYDKLSKAIHTAIGLGLLASILLTFIGVGFTPTLLRIMDTPDTVMQDSVTYFRVYFLGSLGFIMYNAFIAILQGIGDAKHPLYYLAIASITNIVLDILFVKYFNMGVAGAALATLIGQLLSALLCLIRLMRTDEVYHVNFRKINIDKDMSKLILNYGLPSGVQNSIIAFANVVVQTNINAFGDMAMAGCGAFAKIEGFGFIPVTSFTAALSTFVGQNLGAKKYDRAKQGSRFGIICACLISALIGISMYVFAENLIALFDNDPNVIYYGVLRARTASLFFVLCAFSHSVAAVLRGAGQAKTPMFVMLVCWCIIRVLYIEITIRFIFNDILVICFAYPITWFLSSVVYLYLYLKGKWIHNFDLVK